MDVDRGRRRAADRRIRQDGVAHAGIGCGWRLDADGTTTTGPLGAGASGLLIYDERGYMSVGLMRTDPGPDGPEPGGRPVFMGYSGRWRLADDVVVHEAEVGSHGRVVGTEQVRELRLDDGRLVLRERLDESPRCFVLTWCRA